jgi:hypothetical protein
VHTFNRLQIGLHEFTTPGGPLFPTRSVTILNFKQTHPHNSCNQSPIHISFYYSYESNRAVRTRASEAMDALFPWGRSYRDVLGTLFRICNPYFWISNIRYCISVYVSRVTSTILSPFNLVIGTVSYFTSFLTGSKTKIKV